MKTVVFTFGRFNPIHQGHELLVNKVISVAKQNNAKPMVFLSHSYDSKKNPLSYSNKIKFAKIAFGNVIIESEANNFIQILKMLTGKFDHAIIVVGSDRVDGIKKITETYNNKEFKFYKITVVSAGERDPDADGVSGLSASKMRQFAIDNNRVAFRNGLPKTLQTRANDVLKAVRTGLGIQESFSSIKPLLKKLLNK